MEAYRAEATIGTSGELHIEHLPFKAGERVEVVVTPSKGMANGSWPDGYFAATFGAISDDSFGRHPQGQHEAREPLA
jgi:hypothetical protein